MSSVLVDSLPHRSPRREAPERRIEIVSTRAQRRARPRPIYAIVVVGGLFVLFMAQLLMSIVVSDGAYQISSLQTRQVELGRQQQSLSEQVDTLASTQNLAAKAQALGMVQSASTPAFLDAATGKVVGTSHAADANEDGVLDSAGNLVPNALLPEDGTETATDDGITTDAAASDATATTTGTATAGTAATAVDPTDPGTTQAISTGGTADAVALSTGDAATGAPASSTATTPVTSTSGLPVPSTR